MVLRSGQDCIEVQGVGLLFLFGWFTIFVGGCSGIVSMPANDSWEDPITTSRWPVIPEVFQSMGLRHAVHQQ